MKGKIKSVLRLMAGSVARRPKVKRAALSVLNRFPGLKDQLLRISMGVEVSRWYQPVNFSTELTQLSPQARQIYADLKRAIEKNQKAKP